MKHLLKHTTAIVAGVAAMGFVAAGPAVAADAITAVSWGGSYTVSQLEAYHKPYTAKTGMKINSVDYNGGLAEIRAQVEAKNVTWDVVDLELADAVRGCDEGMLAKLPIDERCRRYTSSR